MPCEKGLFHLYPEGLQNIHGYDGLFPGWAANAGVSTNQITTIVCLEKVFICMNLMNEIVVLILNAYQL
jgi:hypothetical protein